MNATYKDSKRKCHGFGKKAEELNLTIDENGMVQFGQICQELAAVQAKKTWKPSQFLMT